MASHLRDLLQAWYPARDEARWVLGTIYQTELSSYRKAGAMMLFNDQGQQFGLLSGGCLEAEMHRLARQVMASGRSRCICFDGSDEDDVSYQFGIGCGGLVRILLQPVTADHDHLQLPDLYAALQARRGGLYRQRVAEDGASAAEFIPDETGRGHCHLPAMLRETPDGHWLETPVCAPPHLLIAGGGADARPLARLAIELGWQVSVWDPRAANARAEHFPAQATRLQAGTEELASDPRLRDVDALVIMLHNLALDAAVLRAAVDLPLAYLALLGPATRRDEVLRHAGLDATSFATALRAPAGLDLGAELPEGIALSILAECHAALCAVDPAPLSAAHRVGRPIHPAAP